MTILSVSPDGEDCNALEGILKLGWTVTPSDAVDSALSVLREITLPIVLCDTDLAPDTWREMLELISHLPDPPLLIVTSRLADVNLWAEALNLGAWDVLPKPFDPEEVTRIVRFAWQHWQNRDGIHSVRTAQRKAAATPSRMTAAS